MSITLKPGPFDGGKWEDLVYMQFESDDGHGFSGWVTPEVSRLVHSAPDLLEALSDLAYRMEYFAARDVRPDKYLLNEWIEKARAAIERTTKGAT